MLTVETIGRIRRGFFVQGKTIKEIARELRISRNTVRKIVRSGQTDAEYARQSQPRPKLGRWTAELEELLAANAKKAAREQLTLIRVFEELRGRGCGGGYDAVRRYARTWSVAHGQAVTTAYVSLSFEPGEAYQFDWSHEVVLLSGMPLTVKAAHVRLCHSRLPFVRVYPRETQEMPKSRRCLPRFSRRTTARPGSSERSKIVSHSFYGALTFLDGFRRTVEVEQAKVRQPGCHNHVGRLACHAAARNPHLYDIHARGQDVEHGGHCRLVRRPHGGKRTEIFVQLAHPLANGAGGRFRPRSGAKAAAEDVGPEVDCDHDFRTHRAGQRHRYGVNQTTVDE